MRTAQAERGLRGYYSPVCVIVAPEGIYVGRVCPPGPVGSMLLVWTDLVKARRCGRRGAYVSVRENGRRRAVRSVQARRAVRGRTSGSRICRGSRSSVGSLFRGFFLSSAMWIIIFPLWKCFRVTTSAELEGNAV